MNLVHDTSVVVENLQSRASIHCAIRALNQAMAALGEFVASLTDAQYAAKPPGGLSSVGSHVRHCLDHVEALVRGLTEGVVDYDHRQRGTDDERSPSAAIQRLADLRAALERSAPVNERYLCVRSMLTVEGQSVRAHSSWSRELVFVLSHTIHHQAMMAATARTVGAEVDSRFGYAPSTLAYLDRTPCAQSA